MQYTRFSSTLKYSLLALGAATLIGCGGSSTSTTSDTTINTAQTAVKTPTPSQLGLTVLGNSAPTAVANQGIGTLEVNTSTNVQFTGSDSNDSDGNITAYLWTDMDNNILSTEADFNRTFYIPGIYEKTLTVMDDQNATAFQRLCLLVGIDQTEIPLIAKAGLDQNVTEDDNVTLSGRAVCRDTNLTYAWVEDGNVTDTNKTFTKSDFSIGTHVLEFRVYDENQNYAWDSLTLTVNPK
ncbi:MAG: PKD domain-containing protein [Epsilonproteobacteria bacterium]|nr:PKD domain-containing protein [Campylobacterota bacterium]